MNFQHRAQFHGGLGISLLLAFSCGDPSGQRPDERETDNGENEEMIHDPQPTDETPWIDEWTIIEDFENADVFGWMATVEGETSMSASSLVSNAPPRGESLQALLFDVPEGVEAAYVWHNHFSPLEQMSALQFWARSDETGPEELLFAMTGLRGEGTTYTSSLVAHQPFRVKRFALSEQWQQYTVLFDELAAEGDGDAQPLYDTEGFLFHIIVEPGAAGQLYLDDIEVACTEGALCSMRAR